MAEYEVTFAHSSRSLSRQSSRAQRLPRGGSGVLVSAAGSSLRPTCRSPRVPRRSGPDAQIPPRRGGRAYRRVLYRSAGGGRSQALHSWRRSAAGQTHQHHERLAKLAPGSRPMRPRTTWRELTHGETMRVDGLHRWLQDQLSADHAHSFGGRRRPRSEHPSTSYTLRQAQKMARTIDQDRSAGAAAAPARVAELYVIVPTVDSARDTPAR